MAKQTKTQDEPRKPGPKFGRSVLPDNFQIRRSPSPMAELLEDAERRGMADASHTPENITPVKSTPVNIAPVEDSLVSASRQENFLPEISVFLDIILPRFPPAR
jgi:hypothetical protein